MEAPVTDGSAPRFPVSIKGVVFIDGRVVLLKNEREEWELPGGKLEPGENPAECVTREILEELGIRIEVIAILDSWLYDIRGQAEVLIVTYGCATDDAKVTLSREHKAVGLFRPEELEGLRMPDGYKRSIHSWEGARAALHGMREHEGKV